ncbi:MAG: HAMP domain-containing histidine kinase [Gammaproteobacteria bacterium]|nr:HAMP domain-containing histidine kinase [Gammaproteobacteria bacterium]MDH5801692.1 HAMP domain-containing histidine kinase [Gammaproteobacteria bacterium]
MKVWKKANIGIKFILTAFPAMAIIVVLLGSYYVQDDRKILRRQLDTLGAGLSQATASFCAAPMVVQDYVTIKTYTDNLIRGNEDIIFVYVLDADNNLVSSSALEDKTDVVPFVYERDILKEPTRVRKLGSVVLGLSPRQMDLAVSERIYDIAMGFVVLFIVFSVMIVFLVKTVVTDPLKKLGDVAEALGKGVLANPITMDQEDEVGRLAKNLETMRTNLFDSYTMVRRKNDQLKSLDKMKDEFLSNMTHELKTPLHAIIGYSELAREDLNNQVNDQLLEDLNKIEASGRRLLEIVNNILSLSSSNESDNRVPYSLMALIEELRLGFEVEVYKNSNKLLVQFHHTHDYVQVDISRFKQMLVHLLNNANKFTHNGKITIDIFDETDEDQHWVTVSVGDDGIGIDQEYLKNLFLPFSQMDSSLTRKYEGTGLGLAVCKKLCESMHGEINVSSVKGQGSVFNVRLPLPVVKEGDQNERRSRQ